MPAFSVTAVDTKGGAKILNNKTPKANSASESCLESTPKASRNSYSTLVERSTNNLVHLEASSRGTPQTLQNGRWVEPWTGANNKRKTASKQ